MTNADKFLKDGVSVEEFIDKLVSFAIINCDHIRHRTIRTFLEVPVKPTLTEDERVILRNINKANNYIGRHKDSIFVDGGKLYVSIRAEAHGWRSLPYNHLFQFIKERRRI